MNTKQKFGLLAIAAFGAVSLPILLQAQSDVVIDRDYPIRVANARIALLENGELEIVGDIALDAPRGAGTHENLGELIFFKSGYSFTANEASIRNGEMRMTSVRISLLPVSP